jgi:magnesium chelatase family protein
VARYRGRLSGPLRDRLDLTVEVPALPVASLTAAAGGEPSSNVRGRVIAARHRQSERYANDLIRTNAELTPALTGPNCPLDAQAARLLDVAVGRMSLSARGYDRVLKVARTIADLAGAEGIGADHIAEALQFRML